MQGRPCSALLLAAMAVLCSCRPAARMAAAQSVAHSPPVPAEYSRRYPWPRVKRAYQALLERTW